MGVFTGDMRAAAIEMWARGWSLRDISAELGVTVKQLKDYICWHRRDFPRRWRQLSDEDIIRMRDMRASGMSVKAVASQFGVCPNTVSRHAPRKGRSDGQRA